MPKHYCVQQIKIDELTASDRKQTLAIFGDPETGEGGMVADIKSVKAMLEQMQPTYKELDSWGTFFKKGKELGLGMVVFLTASGAIYGAIYAIKEWFKK